MTVSELASSYLAILIPPSTLIWSRTFPWLIIAYSNIFIFLFLNFIYLFLAALGPRCRTGFSLVAIFRLLAPVASLAAEHRLRYLQHVGSVFWLPGSRAQAQKLWCTCLVDLLHVWSSRTRNRTHSPALAAGFFTTEPPPRKTLLSFFTFMLGVGIRVGRQGNSEISSKNTDIKTKTLSSEVKSKYQQKSFSSN